MHQLQSSWQLHALQLATRDSVSRLCKKSVVNIQGDASLFGFAHVTRVKQEHRSISHNHRGSYSMPSGHVSCDTAQVIGIAVSLFGFAHVAQVKQEHRSINHNRRGS